MSLFARHRSVSLAAVALALALACSGSDTTTAPVDAAPVPDTSVEVTTAPVARGAIQPRIVAPGSLLPRRASQIGAEVSGRLQAIHVHVGDRVESGQLLFEVDSTTYRAQLAQAEAGLALARAQRAQVAEDLARARLLHEREYVPKQQVDKLRTSLEVTRAQETQARELVAIARLQVERTVVHAPYAGSISERRVDEGTMALTQPQTVVLVLQETSVLEAYAAIPETQLSLIALGDPVRIFLQNIEQPIETTVTTVSDSIDLASRTYQIRMLIPNPDRQFKAGVFARVEVTPRARASALLVPREAVRTEDGETRVYVVQNGLAVAVPVRIGITNETSAEVLSGLDEGAQVIVGESARTIASGMRVRVAGATGRDAA